MTILLKLVSGDYLVVNGTAANQHIRLESVFPIPPVWHTVIKKMPKSSDPIRIRTTDLTK